MKGRESFGLKAKLAAGTGMGGRREVDERRGGRGGEGEGEEAVPRESVR